MKLNTAWPLLLGLLSLALWAGYALLALSVSAADWTPDFMRLPVAADERGVIEMRALFGDSFGAFNALVSTFALIGLLYTIRSQQIQIADQANGHESSQRLARQQQFQEQFYRAIDAYKGLLSDISVMNPDPSQQGTFLNGRNALWAIWRHQLIHTIGGRNDALFNQSINEQIAAYRAENLHSHSVNEKAARTISLLKNAIRVEPEKHQDALRQIGLAWKSVYNIHRFQFDSLFRSWYTAYRVLETAKKYDISDEARRLYSAVFRAQLSWIEMAFLLINQSGLPDNPKFPKACMMSNNYSLFDNLDTESDTVVAVLSLEPTTLEECAAPQEQKLFATAFFGIKTDTGTESTRVQ